MDKLCKKLNWNGFAVSVIGSSHINKDLPCQDASLVVESPRAAAIVCDGRGSAKLSHFGAKAAVRAFQNQIAVFEPMLSTILDEENVPVERWEMFSRIIYRTLVQSKQELVKEYNSTDITEREFDFTVACAIAGKKHIGCFQVGDGAIVLRKNGTTFTVFEPDKGEFANQTVFLRENGELKGKFHSKFIDAENVDGIAITSDGPECLMFKLPELVPSEVFGAFFDDMAAGIFKCQDLRDYLTRKKWSEGYYGSDDRSVALLVLSKASDNSADTRTDFLERAPEAQEMENPDAVKAGKDVQGSPSTEHVAGITVSSDGPTADLCPGTIVFPESRMAKVNTVKFKCLLAGVSLIAIAAIGWGVSSYLRVSSFRDQLALMHESQQKNISRILEQEKQLKELSATCESQKKIINSQQEFLDKIDESDRIENCNTEDLEDESETRYSQTQ